MTDEQLDQLHKEAKAGEQANTAWMAYLKKYTEDKQKEIFQRFLDSSMNDCFMLKYEQMALDQIVSGILLTIETGKLAEKQLEER
jgi:type III secretory pathway component EscR